MKKFLSIVLVVILLSICGIVYADNTTYQISVNGINLVLIDGDKIVNPVEIDGLVYIPLEAFLKATNISYEANDNIFQIIIDNFNSEADQNSIAPPIDAYSPLGLFIQYSDTTIGLNSLINELKNQGVSYSIDTSEVFLTKVVVNGTNDSVAVVYTPMITESMQTSIAYRVGSFKLSVYDFTKKERTYEFIDEIAKIKAQPKSFDALLDKANIAH